MSLPTLTPRIVPSDVAPSWLRLARELVRRAPSLVFAMMVACGLIACVPAKLVGVGITMSRMMALVSGAAALIFLQALMHTTVTVGVLTTALLDRRLGATHPMGNAPLDAIDPGSWLFAILPRAAATSLIGSRRLLTSTLLAVTVFALAVLLAAPPVDAPPPPRVSWTPLLNAIAALLLGRLFLTNALAAALVVHAGFPLETGDRGLALRLAIEGVRINPRPMRQLAMSLALCILPMLHSAAVGLIVIGALMPLFGMIVYVAYRDIFLGERENQRVVALETASAPTGAWVPAPAPAR